MAQAIAVTRPERLAALYGVLAPALVKRFKEREEHVRVDVIATLAALLDASTAASSKGEDAGPDWRPGFLAVAPSALAACLKQLGARAGDKEKSKAACLALLRALCNAARPGELADRAPDLVGGPGGRRTSRRLRDARVFGARRGYSQRATERASRRRRRRRRRRCDERTKLDAGFPRRSRPRPRRSRRNPRLSSWRAPCCYASRWRRTARARGRR